VVGFCLKGRGCQCSNSLFDFVGIDGEGRGFGEELIERKLKSANCIVNWQVHLHDSIPTKGNIIKLNLKKCFFAKSLFTLLRKPLKTMERA